jgi:perosamine synthetase
MDDLLELTQRHRVAIMEDAAHAPQATYRGRRIGTIGRLTVFSFYATKNLTTGEGGMVTTDDDELCDRMRTRRLHGMTRDAWKRYTAEGTWRYDVSYPGYKYNMTDIAAALGRVQLRRLPEMQAHRARLVARYLEGLRGCAALELPVCHDDVEHSWHLFIVRVRPERLTIGRDEVIRQINAAGVGTSVHFIPLHEHSFYREVLGYRAADFPHAAHAFERIISLPLFTRMQFADVDYVVGVLADILHRHRR